MIRMYFNTQVRFGFGVIEQLPKELKQHLVQSMTM